MDENILRFILFLVGITVVLGIYFRERHKRINQRVQQIRQHDAPEMGSLDELYSARSDAQENISVEDECIDETNANELIEASESETYDAPDSEPSAANDTLDNEVLKEDGGPTSSISSDFSDETPPETVDEDRHFSFSGKKDEVLEMPSIQLDASQEKLAALDKLPEMEAEEDYLADDLPNIIIQINISARNRAFTAAEIWQCAKDVELEYGDMPVFHRYASGSQSKVVFSMVNMYEPGTLPEKASAEFETKGLALFAQFPGPEDSMAAFADMLFTAERLGAMLDAELQDESHSALSRQTIEHMREQLLKHRMQVQLARKKRQN